MSASQPASVLAAPKLELKHILVTTDFSDCSRSALKQAAAIAQLHSSDLLVLHIAEPEPILYAGLESHSWDREVVVDKAKQEMRALEREESLANVRHEFLAETGALEDVLRKVIPDREVSMIVVGTHGRSGLKKMIIGSVAEEIFRLASCPVLTIGPDIQPALLTHGRFQSVIFATDFSEGSRHALPYAVAFAQESQAHLTLMHVLDEGSVTAVYLHAELAMQAKSRLQQMAREYLSSGVAFDIEIADGYPVEQILRIARKNQSDLVVLGVHKSSGIGARASAHLPWTIAQSVVCHAKCPVLTVRG